LSSSSRYRCRKPIQRPPRGTPRRFRSSDGTADGGRSRWLRLPQCAERSRSAALRHSCCRQHSPLLVADELRQRANRWSSVNFSFSKKAQDSRGTTQETAFAQTQAKRPPPPLRHCTKGRGKARMGRAKGKGRARVRVRARAGVRAWARTGVRVDTHPPTRSSHTDSKKGKGSSQGRHSPTRSSTPRALKHVTVLPLPTDSSR
jgi:hypothetical protein